MSERKKLVIIDGKSVLYRGYYAMTHLANKEGRPTGATYGFAMMGLKILKELDPDYVIVAWDKSKTNIRSRVKLYEEYKANRKPMPDDLREQLPDVKRLCEAFSWPFLEVDDYEADDIMGTLREQARKKDLEVVLVTSDLDVLQLVNHYTKVLALKTGLSKTVLYDEDKLRREYDMTPEQFIDYKALRGDPSDNIPGVAGVGEKTAKDLIGQFGSLDGVYERLEEVKGAVQKKLEQGKDMAYLSRQLVTIMCDAPVQLDLKAADTNDTDPEAIQSIFRELNFRRLLQELPEVMKVNQQEVTPLRNSSEGQVSNKKKVEGEGQEKTELNDVELEEVDNPEIISEKVVVFTIGDKLFISPETGKCFLTTSQKSLEGKKLIGYDLKADLKNLSTDVHAGFDVMVGAFLLNPLLRQRSLADLASNELGIELKSFAVRRDVDNRSAALITQAIWQLYKSYDHQLQGMSKLHKLATEVEWPLLSVLSRMEERGVKLDVDYLKVMSEDFSERIKELEGAIYKEAGQEFNINSPAQLQTILFEKLQLPTDGIKKTKTGYSTGASELDKLRGLHPVINFITHYRELAKLKSTYIDALPKLVDKNNRLHTTFTQVVAQTGRLSSLHPNLQNIPVRTEEGRAIRTAFTAEPGRLLVQADYSQLELRLAAELSGDEDTIKAFNDGVDIHVQTAAELYGIKPEEVTKEQRYSAKTVNFGVLYGMSPHGLSVATGMSRDEAKEFIQKYFQLRKGLLDYLDGLKQKAKTDGYVETLLGRRRPMPDIHSSNFAVRAAAERAAINMPIQGTAADIMKMAMIELDKKLDEDCWQTLQVHDSILVEVPEAKASDVAGLLKDIMENIYELKVNLDVETSIGSNWGEL